MPSATLCLLAGPFLLALLFFQALLATCAKGNSAELKKQNAGTKKSTEPTGKSDANAVKSSTGAAPSSDAASGASKTIPQTNAPPPAANPKKSEEVGDGYEACPEMTPEQLAKIAENTPN